ncbi:MAG: DNA repair protein RecO [Pseudomonadota bacterium]|nr:DNA repair protein RecO [Pseudomonadota bacterium]
MHSKKRIQNQPAWVLHYKNFSDSSNILDVFTRDFGRVSLIAKGSRSIKSKFRGMLRPFVLLNISWLSRSNLGTLIDVEFQGKPISLVGDALLSAYYINELLIKLLYKDDSQDEIFCLYTTTIKRLSMTEDIAPLLRHFEMELLRLIGYGLNLDEVRKTELPINPSLFYEYKPDIGLVESRKKRGDMIFSGAQIEGIRRKNFDCSETLKCANHLLRNIIAHQLGNRQLNTRKVIEGLRIYEK